MKHDGWTLFLLFVHSFLFAVTAPSDWLEFRGSTGQGIAEDAGPPIKWTQTKSVLWKTSIAGQGWSSPVVYQDSVYLTTAVLDNEENPTSLRLVRIHAKTGQIMWNCEAIAWSGPSEKHGKNSYASSTPVIEEGKIYAHFGHMGTACLDIKGQVLWRQTKLVYPPMHGNGSSPIIAGDKLIFTCDGKVDPFLAALDKHTGNVVWITKRTETKVTNKFSFCTPLLVDEGSREVVVSPYSGAIAAYDPATGKEIWRVVNDSGFSVIPRPVYGDDMVFFRSGYNKTHIYAIRLGGSGDVTDTHVVWKSDHSAPTTPSLLLVDKKLYSVSDRGMISCVDAASSRTFWRESIHAPVSASPIFADGRIYITTEKGKTFVIRAGEKFEILAENDLGERTYASLAVSGDKLYIRTQSQLYCIGKE